MTPYVRHDTSRPSVPGSSQSCPGCGADADAIVEPDVAEDRAEREKLSAVIASLGDGLLVLDEAQRVESINLRGEQILEVVATDVLGRPIDDLARGWKLRDRGAFAVSKMRHHLLRALPYRNDDAFVVSADGTITHVSLVMNPITRDGRSRGAVICLRDITDMKVAQNRLREGEERFRRIFRDAPTGMIRIAADGTIDDCNPAFQRMLGWGEEALMGRTLAELWHPQEAQESGAILAEVLRGERSTWQGERRFLHASGSTVWTATSLALVRPAGGDQAFAIGVVEDGTKRKQLEIQLRHAQKLESVGRLAAGIAHELNTPVQFIGSNVQFVGEAFTTVARIASSHAPADEPGSAELAFLHEEVPVAIQQTLDGVQRVAEIVKAMKGFGEPSGGGHTDVNEAVRNSVAVASSDIERVADVEIELEEGIPLLECDPMDFNQVLLHLLVNAGHAIEDRAADVRGRIRICTRIHDGGVEVSISDTGTGIPEEIHDQVFDPFFTTKAVGRGSGQGLALAHAVVTERHGGELSFTTEMGEGTTFVLRFPPQPHSTDYVDG